MAWILNSSQRPTPASGRERVAQALMDAGSSPEPVQSWTQGAAKLAQGYMGGLLARDAGMGTKPMDIRPPAQQGGMLMRLGQIFGGGG